MSNWYGWFIEQSMDDQAIFGKYKTVKMKSEEESWKEHVVEIPSEEINDVINWLKKFLKLGWYSHMVNGNEIVVVYKDKAFCLTQGQDFAEVAKYGKSLGIPDEQLPSDKLFALARKSGY